MDSCGCTPGSTPDIVILSDSRHPLFATTLATLAQHPDFAVVFAPRAPFREEAWQAVAPLLAGVRAQRIADDAPIERGQVYILPCCAEYTIERSVIRLLRFPFPEQRVHFGAGLAPDTYRHLSRDAAILSALTDGVVIADADGNILEMNAAAMYFHGVCSETEARLPIQEYTARFQLRSLKGVPIPYEQCPLTRVTRRECFQGLTYEMCDTERHSRRYLNYSGTPVYSEGEFRYAILTLRDVTQEETARQRLLENELAFKAAIEHYPTPFVIYDADERIRFINRAGVEACARPLDQLLGYRSEELNKPEVIDAYLPLLKRAYATKEMQQGEVKVVRAGESHDVEMTFVPILDERQEIRRTLGITHDLTDTHKAKKRIEDLNRQLQAQTWQLRQTVSELESFSYAVAHDLLAPLRAMVGFAQVLREDYATELDAEGQAFAERIESAGLHMARLLDDILRLSRVSVQEFTPTEVDLAQLARGALRDIDAEERYEIRVPDAIPEHGDEGLLRLALKNLLSNAVKYSRHHARPRVELGIHQRANERVYFVRDNGVGFDPVDARNLFKPFSRLHDKSQFEGNGIGLAIVRRAIERHGGRVWVDSAMGEGSTFFFTLSSA